MTLNLYIMKYDKVLQWLSFKVPQIEILVPIGECIGLLTFVALFHPHSMTWDELHCSFCIHLNNATLCLFICLYAL